MNEILIIAGDYLKGKSIYPSIRRILNLLFNISIASFVFQKFYGNYTWLNYYDYKGILDFLVKGKFFIPLSIFFIVYGFTQFLAMSFFYLISHFKSVRLAREILAYQYNKESVEQGLNDFTEVSKIVSPVTLTKDVMVELYKELRKNISEETINEIEKSLEEPKKNLENNFYLLFRMLIAVTIYFISLAEFSWLLYLVVGILLVIVMLLIMVGYRFLDLLPVLIGKFTEQAEQYFMQHSKANGKMIDNS